MSSLPHPAGYHGCSGQLQSWLTLTDLILLFVLTIIITIPAINIVVIANYTLYSEVFIILVL